VENQAMQDDLVTVEDAKLKELHRRAEHYRAYARLFKDDQIRHALIEYAALLEAKVKRPENDT
jgi:hypothetical protein